MRTPHAQLECRALSPPLRLEQDAGALFHGAHPGEEEARALELGLERERLLGRERNEQPACRLRVVREREQLVRHAVAGDVRAGEVAVARIAARAHSGAGRFQRAGLFLARVGAVEEGAGVALDP